MKAVISSGNKQYLVSEGETISVEIIKDVPKTVSFEPLLLINKENITVGNPLVSKHTVSAELVEADMQTDKVTSIRYKAKKRVHTVKGHRQRQTVLKIVKIV